METDDAGQGARCRCSSIRTSLEPPPALPLLHVCPSGKDLQVVHPFPRRKATCWRVRLEMRITTQRYFCGAAHTSSDVFGDVL